VPPCILADHVHSRGKLPPRIQHTSHFAKRQPIIRILRTGAKYDFEPPSGSVWDQWKAAFGIWVVLFVAFGVLFIILRWRVRRALREIPPRKLGPDAIPPRLHAQFFPPSKIFTEELSFLVTSALALRTLVSSSSPQRRPGRFVSGQAKCLFRNTLLAKPVGSRLYGPPRMLAKYKFFENYTLAVWDPKKNRFPGKIQAFAFQYFARKVLRRMDFFRDFALSL